MAVVAVTMGATLIFIVGWHWQLLSFATLAATALWAYNFPKIGTDYMPPLDEGSILDMPITSPRVSVTQASDDLKARDSMLRRFPEVEMVVGKAGRADTPTDPSPLDMVETIVTLRPRSIGRGARSSTATRKGRPRCAGGPATARTHRAHRKDSDRRALADGATMNAVARFDEAMREFVLQRYQEFEAALGPKLLREFVAELVARLQKAGRLLEPVGQSDVDRVAGQLDKEFAGILTAGPGQADVNRLVQRIAEKLAADKKVEMSPDLLTADFNPLYDAYLGVMGVMGSSGPRSSPRCSISSSGGATPAGAARSPRSIMRSSTRPSGPTTGTPSRSSARRPRPKGFGPKRPTMPRSRRSSRRSALSWTPPGRRTSSSGRTPRKAAPRTRPTWARSWRPPSRCPAGPTSSPSRSLTASTCSPPACAR